LGPVVYVVGAEASDGTSVDYCTVVR